jgi:AraC family transcriptional regulator, transcriptional activator FtrA
MAMFELGIVLEVFGLPRPELQVPWWYTIDVFSVSPGPHPTLGGVALQVERSLEVAAAADTVMVPGWPVDSEVPAPLIAALRQASDRGARLVSICSGAFALAAAGVLDGRRVATHWQYAERLARSYPALIVDPDVLYVDEGSLLTSAGSAAGIDLCLHLIRRDHGADIANRVARRLVMQPHRAGGQAQFIERPVPADDDSRIHDVISWLAANLAAQVTVDNLAARAHLSQRQFSRRFRAVTGQSPLEWLIGQRIAASLAYLDSGDNPVEQVAAQVGFSNPVTFRHHFRARMHTSPQAYRRAFQATRADETPLAAVTGAR